MKRALRNGSLARWCSEAGCAILFSWIFSYEALLGSEHLWILYLGLAALGMLFVDVVAYLLYNYL